MVNIKGAWLRSKKGLIVVLMAANLVIAGCAGSASKPTTIPATRALKTPSVASSPTQSPIPTSTKTPTSTPSPTPEPYLFTISQETAEIRSGRTKPLTAFQINETRPFPEDYLLATDEKGEALLQGRLDNATCRIYVFQDTELRKRPCPESTYTGGNASCVEAGSAVYQDCSNHLAMTPSGEVQFQGTWVQVIYLPEQQVSIFVAAQGNALVSPVTGSGSRLTRPIPLAAGQFLYTAPDSVMNAIPGLAPRQALSVDRLPALLPEYNILPWLARGFEKVSPNNTAFPSPDLLTGPPDLVASLEVTGPVSIGNNRLSPVLVPVRVTVTNRGGETADIFKVSIDGATSAGTFVRPFYTQANPDGYYPFSEKPLEPGGQITFDGQVGFTRNDLGQQISLTALADSCSGDEFVPEECRVMESNENNNVSEPVNVLLLP